MCAQQPRDVWTLDRVAPLRFKVRISKHDYYQSLCSCNELGMWCVPTNQPAVPKLLKKKKITKTIESLYLASGPESKGHLRVEEKRYHSERAAFLEF